MNPISHKLSWPRREEKEGSHSSQSPLSAVALKNMRNRLIAQMLHSAAHTRKPLEAIIRQHAIREGIPPYDKEIELSLLDRFLGSLGEKPLRHLEVSLRQLVNYGQVLIHQDFFEHIDGLFQKLGSEAGQEEQIKVFMEYYKEFLAGRKEAQVSVNDEFKERLDKITDDCYPTIFVFNHDNIKNGMDECLLNLFTLELYQSYLDKGKGDSCPKPRILLNDMILDTMTDLQRGVLEQGGVLALSTSPDSSREKAMKNGRAMSTLMRENSNIFVFPESSFALLPEIEFKNRMQPGTAKLISTMLTKPRNLDQGVRLIPVGFAFSDANQQRKAHIELGESVYFQNTVDTTPDNIHETIVEKLYSTKDKAAWMLQKT